MADSQILGAEEKGPNFVEPQMFACHLHRSYLTESSKPLYRIDIFMYIL